MTDIEKRAHDIAVALVSINVADIREDSQIEYPLDEIARRYIDNYQIIRNALRRYEDACAPLSST